jgi:hypothetical protein
MLDESQPIFSLSGRRKPYNESWWISTFK